jgi:hypothetical protein
MPWDHRCGEALNAQGRKKEFGEPNFCLCCLPFLRFKSQTPGVVTPIGLASEAALHGW